MAAPGFSFKFTKKTQSRVKVLTNNKALGNDDDPKEIVKSDFITAIDKCEIISTDPTTTGKDLVIPLIVNNNWRIANLKRKYAEKALAIKQEPGVDIKLEVSTETSSSFALDEGTGKKVKEETPSLDELAKQELLSEVKRENDEWEKRGPINSNRVIPILMRNAVPQGFEEDDNFDVSVRADNPTQDDYEKVPVEEFGLAMLRGMGWKPGEAVGGKVKKLVAPLEVIIRPKGLGLGAGPSNDQKANSKISITSSKKDGSRKANDKK
ncbi:G-patch domain and KOW motifs-containing protein [Halotydeus destructor]|nr:G-patch domain and KOW motifs-containing protein [Halotydeus destructor]